MSKKREKHGHWKGGRNLMQSGYIRINTPDGWKYEHRLVMEKILGRPLASNEVVHHKDGNRKNNHPHNLIIMIKNRHDRKETTRRHKEKPFGFKKGHIPKHAIKWSDKDKIIIKSLFESGFSGLKISKLLKVNHKTIYKVLDSLGIKRKKGRNQYAKN